MCVNGVQNPLFFQQCSLVFVQFGAMVKQFMTLEPRIPVPSMITHDLIVSCWNCHQYVPRDWTQNLDSMEPQWWFISRGHHQIRGFLYLWVRFWILCCMNILRKWDNEMNRYVSTIVLVSSSGLCSPQGVAWAFRVSSGRQQGFQSTALWMVGHKRDDAIGFKRNQETLMV